MEFFGFFSVILGCPKEVFSGVRKCLEKHGHPGYGNFGWQGIL